MAVRRLTAARKRRCGFASSPRLLIQALLILLASRLGSSRMQVSFGVAAVSESDSSPMTGKAAGGVSPPEVGSPASTSRNEESMSPTKKSPQNNEDQQRLGSSPRNGRRHAEENDNTRENWALSALRPELLASYSAPIKRPFDLLQKAAALFGDSPWLLTTDNAKRGPISPITYRQGLVLAATVGSALDCLLPNSRHPHHDGANEPLRLLGTWAANSVELLLADFGAGAYGLTVVPVHPEMNPRRFLEIMIHTPFCSPAGLVLLKTPAEPDTSRDYLNPFALLEVHPEECCHGFLEPLLVQLTVPAEMTHLCTDLRHLDMVLDLVEQGQLPNLSTIITLDAVGDQTLLRGRALELIILEFWDLTNHPKASADQRHNKSSRQRLDSADIHAVIYPRALSMPFNGTMLSNENILASLETLTDWRVGAVALIEGDLVLCADSLASVHQRVMHLAVIQAGATAVFSRNGLLTLQEDIRSLQPTVVSATGGILPLLHASMGRLRRFLLLLKLRWRARSYWQTSEVDLLARPPFKELKNMLSSVHTLFVAPALASSELIKELQLLYSILIVHACCSPQTGVAFSARQQNGNPGYPKQFQRIRAAPLGWASPVVTVALEKLSASDAAGLVDLHPDGAPGGQGGTSPLILSPTPTGNDNLYLASGSADLDEFHPTVVSKWRKQTITEGEVVIQGACVSVGYYRHQTAFQRQLTARGMYRTGLVAISAGDDYPLLMVSALSRNVLTAEGEFIDLAEAERQIRKVPIVRRVLLYADDFHSPLVAIIQPRRSAVIRWAKRRFAFSDDYGASYENLVSLPALKHYVLQQVEVHTWLTLESFERPKCVYLVPHDVALPLGVLDKELDGKSSGLSILRAQLADAYAKPIREMYASLSE